jgi:hypothetical protein
MLHDGGELWKIVLFLKMSCYGADKEIRVTLEKGALWALSGGNALAGTQFKRTRLRLLHNLS